MQVGEVAARTGVSVRAVRYYERCGLVDAVRRENGYREFDDSAVERVRDVRGLLETGFTVAEVHSLLPCLRSSGDDDAGCCVRTVALYRRKLAKIDAQLRTLTRLRSRIEERVAVLEPC
ncbi:MAG: MerR family transcriptional regulator [Gemmatimonadaceae bacterium]